MMIKKILITLFLLTFIVNLFAQNPISRDDAYKIILQKGLVDTLTNDVKVHQEIIRSKTVLDFMGESMTSPEWDSWFFLIDLQPDANWGHPCKYVYVNTINSSLIVIDGQRDASFRTDILFGQRFNGVIHAPVFFRKKPL